ncbi:Alpha/Beta hydrolase protein [Suillus fuscotomentosus]|uniref:acylaminoacyl-peptidase n=1 Tax=Suillus fuscotomentosus TaxID=1912939 RepID=A0AAD4E3Y3_9AGAM|nr:Alpha/Beta hydrolase protein [Suillus fuscotomentosus]KAG1898892.1 Alpha/Beta hydrolase protein [Suillus fuscotomentosus]
MSLQYTGSSTFYTELAEISLPVSADFIGDSRVARVTYSVRDHDRNIKRYLTKTFDNQCTTSHDSSEIKAFATSPSKSRQAILREVANSKRFVEIWAGTQLEASLDVSNYHQAFLTDDFLYSLSFSPSETSLLYTAEASINTDDDPYNKFRYTPHFGDTCRAKKRPTIFLFSWTGSPSFTRAAKQDSTLFALQPTTESPILFAQATFATEDTIFATGHEQTKDGRILGAKGCFNRPMGIWQLTLSKDSLGSPSASRLTPQNRSCRSPRVLFHNDQPIKLFWFSNPIGGPHASCVSLESRDLLTGTNTVLVRTVFEPTPSNNFPGLYTEYNMPTSPFLRRGDSIYIVLQSIWRSRTTVLFIDTQSGEITDATKLGDGPLYSWTLHAADNKSQFICSRSTPTTPWEVLLGSFDQHDTLEWKVLDKSSLSSTIKEALNDLTPSIIPITARAPVETLLIQSKKASTCGGPKPVCVTILHGGPHATSTTSFFSAIVALALEGYTLNIPNYTGSMGFGQTYIQKLLGHCGSMDVEDVTESVRELIRRGVSEEGRQVVMGGSHGGFIAAHLIGQHPTLFNAASLRNPVISAGEFAAGTDIPDWVYSEFGVSSTDSDSDSYTSPTSNLLTSLTPTLPLMTPKTYNTLFTASPIAHVDNITAPVLILIGEDDLRVVPGQGIGFYHAIKGRGEVRTGAEKETKKGTVEVLSFPGESHGIDGVEAARVSFEATRDWFKAFGEGG